MIVHIDLQGLFFVIQIFLQSPFLATTSTRNVSPQNNVNLSPSVLGSHENLREGQDFSPNDSGDEYVPTTPAKRRHRVILVIELIIL